MQRQRCAQSAWKALSPEEPREASSAPQEAYSAALNEALSLAEATGPHGQGGLSPRAPAPHVPPGRKHPGVLVTTLRRARFMKHRVLLHDYNDSHSLAAVAVTIHGRWLFKSYCSPRHRLLRGPCELAGTLSGLPTTTCGLPRQTNGPHESSATSGADDGFAKNTCGRSCNATTE